MIALLIGTIVLGFSAPMISRQLKHNNYSDAQAQIINKRIDKLIESNNALKQEIETLKKSSGGVPKGTVAFFNNTVDAESATNPCPKGWSLIDSNWQGRFPRFAGSYTVLDYNPSTKSFKTTGTAQTLNVGATQEDAIRKITGTSTEHFNSPNLGSVIWASGAFFSSRGSTWGNGGSGSGYTTYNRVNFDSSRVVPTDIENRPRTVALLGCVKN